MFDDRNRRDRENEKLVNAAKHRRRNGKKGKHTNLHNNFIEIHSDFPLNAVDSHRSKSLVITIRCHQFL